MKVKGRKVLDLGGTMGDTAIYFSLQGADEVISYESRKALCVYAEKNFTLNNIKNARIVNQEASSSTIDKFAKKFASYPKSLKIDCEGAEYEMIANAQRLKDYDDIMLEYHDDYSSLKKRLQEEDFNVSASIPRLGPFNGGSPKPVGIIYARNKRVCLKAEK